MNMNLLERRRDPRTQAFVPVTLHCHDSDEVLPAHLLDVSCGGAGVLTTAYNAPATGQYIEMEFAVPTNDGASESPSRQETGMVIHVGNAERGIKRLSVRFLQHRGIGSDLFDPKDVLSSYRQHVPISDQGRRWDPEAGERADTRDLATAGA